MKSSKILPYIITVITCLFLIACKQEKTTKMAYFTLSGQAMGTTYNIKFRSDRALEKYKLDSIFDDFNLALSNYIPNSTITKLSKADGRIAFSKRDDRYFEAAYKRAVELHKETDGYFDPTISPLMNYWGFGYGSKEKIEEPNKSTIDSLKSLCGFDNLGFNETADSLIFDKKNPSSSINMNASAKGKGVDVISLYLEGKGITDYMVEVGGEIRAKGMSNRGSVWVVGINTPDPSAPINSVELPVKLNDKSMASSGNYRQFYKSGEITYGHIIDPFTGYSRPTDILSASVVADDCETADAYATAIMVMGLDKAKELIERSNIEACLLYGEDAEQLQHWYSSGFDAYLLKTE